MLPSSLRYMFWFLNKFFMVPVFRIGLGPIFGNPFWGYMMVLKTTGRKSGKVRYAPVNYTIMDGNVYCLAGFGHISDWYRNMQANPRLEVILPGGAIAGLAEEVSDPAEKVRAARRVLKAGGFAGFLMGVNPYAVSDARLAQAIAASPVIRIRPCGLGVGASDPVGWLWVPVLAALVWLILKQWL